MRHIALSLFALLTLTGCFTTDSERAALMMREDNETCAKQAQGNQAAFQDCISRIGSYRQTAQARRLHNQAESDRELKALTDRYVYQ